MYRRAIRFSFAMLLCLTGCATQKLQNDHHKIRDTLLDLYTDQIMDNLVRASNGMPIIHLDYNNASATVTMKESANIGYSHADTDGTVTAIPAAVTTLSQTFVNGLTANFGADRTNQVTLSATPVTSNNEVYDAYLQFLSLPGSLIVSPEPPPCDVAHIWKNCGDRYYWVPVEYRREFLKLSLVTTAQRGKALLPTEDFFAARLTKLVHIEDGQFDNVKHLTIQLDRPIPNDLGWVQLDIDKSSIEFPIKPFDGDGDFPPSKTDKIVVVFKLIPQAKLATVDQFKNILPIDAKIVLQHEHPKPPSTDELLDRANFQLEQLRMNQLRQGDF